MYFLVLGTSLLKDDGQRIGYEHLNTHFPEDPYGRSRGPYDISNSGSCDGSRCNVFGLRRRAGASEAAYRADEKRYGSRRSARYIDIRHKYLSARNANPVAAYRCEVDL